MHSGNVKKLTIAASRNHLAPQPTPSGRSSKITAVGESQPRLWIRTVAGPSIGFGHLRRCLILADLLSEVASPDFLLDPNDSWSRQAIEDRGWRTLVFDTKLLRTAEDLPGGILIDTRQVAGLAPFIDEAQDLGVKVTSIHDLGLALLGSDIAIDGSIRPILDSSRPLKTRYHLGTEFLVLDPVFGWYRQRRKHLRARIEKVFVNLGGGDSSRFFHTVMEGLRCWGHPLEVVGMPGFSDWGQEELTKINWNPLRFRLASPHENPCDLVFRSDIAITAGGLSLYEALCVGTPACALSYDEFQHVTIDALAQSCRCVDLGFGVDLEAESLAEVLWRLDRDLPDRERLSMAGKQLVDGRGAERVADIIGQTIRNERNPGTSMGAS